MSTQLDPATLQIHHPYSPPAGFASVQPGVFKASTVIFANTAALRARNWKEKSGYTYGLHGTPTTFTLEERIATLEGGTQTLLLPSGLAAIALVNLALLRGGDDDVRALATVLGVQYSRVDATTLTHSNTLTVLDAQGLVAHQLEGLRQPVEDTVGRLEVLAR